MAEKSPFFCTQSDDDVFTSPAASDGRPLSFIGTKCQRPVPERKCSRVRAAVPCGICLETVSDQGLLLKRVSCGMLVASCSHQYCFMCVLTWAERTNTCPLCKKRFNAVRRKPSQTLRGVGETVEVEYKDPPADPPSENEDMAAALALDGEHNSEEAEEDHVLLRRRGAHGYEIDDFVVSEGSCEEEDDDDEDWHESSDVEVLDENRRWTRARTRDNSTRRVRASAITSPAPVRGVRTRTRQSVLPWGRGAAQATGRQEIERREERRNNSRVDSHGTENIVGSTELRQLQQEAARVLGDSPLRSRRGLPPLAARSQRPRPLVAVDSSTSDDDSDFISTRYDRGDWSDESTSGNDREQPRRGGYSSTGAGGGYSATYSSKDDAEKEANEVNDEEEDDKDEDWVPLRDGIATRRINRGGRRSSPSNTVSMRRGRDSYVGARLRSSTTYSSKDDASNSVDRERYNTMTGKEPSEEDDKDEDWVPLRDRIATRRINGGGGRSSSSNAVSMGRGGDSYAGARRGYSTTYSSKDDANNGIDRVRDETMTGKEPSEEEDEDWVPLRNHIVTRQRNGGGRRSSSSNTVSMRSSLALSERSLESRRGVASGNKNPPTAAGRRRGGSVNDRTASSLRDARRSAAEPTWSPWMSAKRGSSNIEQSLRRSSGRTRSGIQSGSNRVTRGGSSNSERPVGGSFGRASSAVRGGLSNRGSSLRNVDGSLVSGGNRGAGRRREKTSEGIIEKENGRGGDVDDGAFLSLGSEDEGFEEEVVSEKGKRTKRPRPRGMCDPGECQSRGRGRRRTNIEGFLNQFRFNGSSA